MVLKLLRKKSTEEAHSFNQISSNQTSKDQFTKIEALDSDQSLENEPIVIDKQVEKRVLRKLDIFVVTWFAIFYFFCQLDRSNIGFAQTDGFIDDIGLKGNEFGNANSYLYITYLTFEPINTLIVKKVTPKYLMIGCAFAWGLTTLSQAFIQNAGGLYACRLVMGLFESGILPVIYVLTSTIYTKSEKTKRHSFVYFIAAFASAFGGLLAYGLLRVTGPKHLEEGWRIMFFVEGLMTIGVLPLAIFIFPKNFETSWFFNEEEKKCYAQRLIHYPELYEKDDFKWSVVWDMFKDFKFYAEVIWQFCCVLSFFASSTFLPTIVSSMGYEGIKSNLMVVPIYMYGAIYYIIVATLSDYFKNRSIFMAISALAMLIGYIIIYASKKDGVRYFGCFFMIMGVYPGTGLNMMWLGDNLPSHYQKAAYMGFTMALGNTAGLAYGQVFRDNDAPRYQNGIKVGLALTAVALVDVLIQIGYYKYLNNKKLKALEEAERQGTPLEEQPELHDKNPHYLYTF
ncbi:putative membrane protein [Wickerhamomyces ciferrii]|uniref:Membrane protein n=1 Tax=Wickerhamomyces ciferrii (strain ATCC 14091 / BCRC 22168 / CBS 111 / JCM 3599 / NBRC 0793 / NRRL Y-1031 F-60-10) TaxID=1206466 RepID=K0KJW3_WICCF|nr:uncharacterized protein BN7_944 [Wickerhamomyces ciferrii]CCH41403.1 putative membrane protein [Wickerhamomyces ciferrii]